MLSKYTADEVRELLTRTERVLSRRPVIERVSPPVLVIGDVHGDLSSLTSSIRLAEDEGAFPVILGDFIDRSPDGLNIETAVAVMELAASGRAIVLRGNHENFLQMSLGTYLELAPDLLTEYEDDPDLIRHFGEAFQELPLVAITDSVVMTHAGVPPLPFSDIDGGDPDIAVPLTWADPEERPVHGLYTFDSADVSRFLGDASRNVVVRGHTAPLNRIVVYDSVLTLQTTRTFRDAGAGGVNVAMVRDEVTTVDQVETFTLEGKWRRTMPIFL